MTPKEKAEELLDKYRNEFKWVEIDYPVDLYRDTKQCAIIAVDEIIEDIEMFGYSSTFYDHEETGKMTCTDDEPPTLFWNKVKQEITNL